jgi:predicted DNA-binding protein (MmcQ/YjbR family)
MDQKVAAVRAWLEAKPGAAGEALPLSPGVTLFKVMGKMFAILEARRLAGVILKCDPHLAEILRQQYQGVGHRSHLDRRFWIWIDLNADVPLDEIERLAAHSYDQVRAKLTKKQRAELQALSA